jgi:hypothetical protein
LCCGCSMMWMSFDLSQLSKPNNIQDDREGWLDCVFHECLRC